MEGKRWRSGVNNHLTAGAFFMVWLVGFVVAYGELVLGVETGAVFLIHDTIGSGDAVDQFLFSVVVLVGQGVVGYVAGE